MKQKMILLLAAGFLASSSYAAGITAPESKRARDTFMANKNAANAQALLDLRDRALNEGAAPIVLQTLMQFIRQNNVEAIANPPKAPAAPAVDPALTKAHDDIAKLTAEVTKLTSKLTAAIAAAKDPAALKALQDDLDQAKRDLTTAIADVASLRGDNSSLQGQLTTLQGQIAQLTKDLADAAAGKSAADTKAAALQKQVDDLKARIDALTLTTAAEKKTFADQIAGLNKQISTLSSGADKVALTKKMGNLKVALSKIPVAAAPSKDFVGKVLAAFRKDARYTSLTIPTGRKSPAKSATAGAVAALWVKNQPTKTSDTDINNIVDRVYKALPSDKPQGIYDALAAGSVAPIAPPVAPAFKALSAKVTKALLANAAYKALTKKAGRDRVTQAVAKMWLADNAGSTPAQQDAVAQDIAQRVATAPAIVGTGPANKAGAPTITAADVQGIAAAIYAAMKTPVVTKTPKEIFVNKVADSFKADPKYKNLKLAAPAKVKLAQDVAGLWFDNGKDQSAAAIASIVNRVYTAKGLPKAQGIYDTLVAAPVSPGTKPAVVSKATFLSNVGLLMGKNAKYQSLPAAQKGIKNSGVQRAALSKLARDVANKWYDANPAASQADQNAAAAKIVTGAASAAAGTKPDALYATLFPAATGGSTATNFNAMDAGALATYYSTNFDGKGSAVEANPVLKAQAQAWLDAFKAKGGKLTPSMSGFTVEADLV